MGPLQHDPSPCEDATVSFLEPRPDTVILEILDLVGVAVFAAGGALAAGRKSAQVAEAGGLPGIVVVLLGTMTGVAVGVLRDVLVNDVPMILRRGNLYASAALGGTATYLVLQEAGVPRDPAAVSGMAFIVTLRVAAIVWGAATAHLHREGLMLRPPARP